MLKLPKSVYYYWIKHMDDQEQKDQWLVEKIKEIVSTHKGRYGYRRIKVILEHREQIVMNHKRLLRIMKAYKLL